MAEDIQEEVTEEQVEQEATQISFGQGNDVDTSSDDAGQVESSTNSWEGDKRYEEHWAKDPNKMYESLRYHEKGKVTLTRRLTIIKSKSKNFLGIVMTITQLKNCLIMNKLETSY